MWRAPLKKKKKKKKEKKKEQVASVESANQMTAWLYQTQPTSHSKGGGTLFKNYLLYVLVPTRVSSFFFCFMALQCEFRRIFVRTFQFVTKLYQTLR